MPVQPTSFGASVSRVGSIQVSGKGNRESEYEIREQMATLYNIHTHTHTHTHTHLQYTVATSSHTQSPVYLGSMVFLKTQTLPIQTEDIKPLCLPTSCGRAASTLAFAHTTQSLLLSEYRGSEAVRYLDVVALAHVEPAIDF